jgi:hypothetical protein
VLAAPIVLLAAWVGIALIVRAMELNRRGSDEGTEKTIHEPSRGVDRSH